MRRRGQSDFRALTPFASLGPEHSVFPVTDDASAPHLRKGEYAVVDATDRDPQRGELYVIQEGDYPPRIVQVRAGEANIIGPSAAPSLVWWVGDLRGWRRVGGDRVPEGNIPLFEGLSDGPYLTQGLRSQLIGRIVGVLDGDSPSIEH
jgi:hypothetical protein